MNDLGLDFSIDENKNNILEWESIDTPNLREFYKCALGKDVQKVLSLEYSACFIVALGDDNNFHLFSGSDKGPLLKIRPISFNDLKQWTVLTKILYQRVDSLETELTELSNLIEQDRINKLPCDEITWVENRISDIEAEWQEIFEDNFNDQNGKLHLFLDAIDGFCAEELKYLLTDLSEVLHLLTPIFENIESI